MIICRRPRLKLQLLPETLVDALPDAEGAGFLLEDVERRAILDALESCGYNRRLTAGKLGISKRTLQYRLKRYGLIDKD